MRKNQNPKYDICCAYCEWACYKNDDEMVFCKKKKRDISSDGRCRSFIYDLLKRKPQTLKLPEIEFPVFE